MEALALITRADQSFAIEPVEVPAPEPDQVLIRTLRSGVSLGTEFALIRNKISWGPYPLCTGYQATGVIETVGAAVQGYRPGDRVYVRGCDRITLRDGAAVSPVSGAHCSRLVRRVGTNHAFDLLPQGADLCASSLFVMPAVGFHGVDLAAPKLGDLVVIHGCGLIGLGALAACAQRGCTVVAVDVSDRALAMAAAFGADVLVNSAEQNAAEEVKKRAPGGADVVFECTGLPACVNPAVELCRPHGTFVWQGNYGSDPVAFHFLSAHRRQLRMCFPCDDGLQPTRRVVLKQMALGTLPWEKTITHRVSFREAPRTYAAIHRKESDALGVVIDWEKAA